MSDSSRARRDTSYDRTAVSRSVLILVCILSIAMHGCTRNKASAKANAIKRGDALAAGNQFAKAIAAYRSAVDYDPSDGQVRVKLVNAYMSERRWDDALKEALEAAQLHPDDLQLQMLATSRLLGSGHFLEAVLRASDLLRKHPDDVDVNILAGNATARLLNSTWALFKLLETVRDGDDFERARIEIRPAVPASEDRTAEQYFRAALKRGPAVLEAQMALINFLWAVGKPNEAEDLLRAAANQNPGHALLNHALGAFYVWRQMPADAEPYLKNAAAAGSYGIGARFMLADLYIAAKRDRDALAVLRPMADANDEAGAVSLRAAPLEFRLGDGQAAMRRIDRFRDREPQNPRALLLKAQFLVGEKQFDEAVKFAREAVSATPGSVEARTALGQALFGTGDRQGAFEALVEAARLGPGVPEPQLELTRVALALGRNKEAVQFARDAVRHLPDNLDAVVMLAKSLIRDRSSQDAEWEIKQFLTRFPDSADLQVQLGTLYAERGDVVAARAAFTRALQANGNSFDALSGIVELDLQDGHIASARQRAESAAASQADNPQVLLLAARVYTADKDLARAESTLRRLVTMRPAHIEATLALSDLLLTRHQEAEGKQLLEQLIERRPRSFEVETALARFLERTNHLAEARVRYEKIVAAYPRAAVASYRLAGLYLDHGGDLDTALNLAIAAKQMLPDDGDASAVLGRIYQKKRLPSYALMNFEDAVKAAPNNAEHRYRLGSAYATMLNYKRARAELTRAVEIAPDFLEARTALASLK